VNCHSSPQAYSQHALETRHKERRERLRAWDSVNDQPCGDHLPERRFRAPRFLRLEA
jgi:hypothetical protein